MFLLTFVFKVNVVGQSGSKNNETVIFFDLTQSCFDKTQAGSEELKYCIRLVKQVMNRNLKRNNDRLTISYIGDSKPSSMFNLILELKGIKNCNNLSGLANLTCIAQNKQYLEKKLTTNKGLVEKHIKEPATNLLNGSFSKKTNILTTINYASDLFINSSAKKEIYYFSDFVETKNFNIENLIKNTSTDIFKDKNIKIALDDLKSNQISDKLKGVNIYYYMPGRQTANKGVIYEKYESFWVKFFNSLTLKIIPIEKIF